MVKRQHISYYADEREAQDFEAIKQALERRTNSDTIRAMIRYCKKNLLENGAIAPNPSNDSDLERPQTGDDQIYVKALREYMLKNGINQDELAERLQVSPAAVGKWLLGHNGITLRNRDKIRRLCGNFPGEEG